MMETEHALDVEPVEQPAKAWRNWWRTPMSYSWHCAICGMRGHTRFGEIESDHCLVYPSKDLAETVAQSDAEEAQYWLGAFPEGERP